MNLGVYFYVLICLSGPTCPKEPIVGSKSYLSEQSCETGARLVAQSMFVMSRDKYGFRCEPVDYEPPNLKAKL